MSWFRRKPKIAGSALVVAIQELAGLKLATAPQLDDSVKVFFPREAYVLNGRIVEMELGGPNPRIRVLFGRCDVRWTKWIPQACVFHAPPTLAQVAA